MWDFSVVPYFDYAQYIAFEMTEGLLDFSISRLLDWEIASFCVLAMTCCVDLLIWLFVSSRYDLLMLRKSLEVTVCRLLDCFVLRSRNYMLCLFVVELLVWFLSRAFFEMTKGFLDFLIAWFFYVRLLRPLSSQWHVVLFVDLLMSCLCDFSVVLYFDFAQYIAFEMIWRCFSIRFTHAL